MKKLEVPIGASGLAHSARRGGAVLVLVVIAVATAMILSLSFLAGQSTLITIAQNVSSHSCARGIAESGLQLALGEVYANADWRTDHTDGLWVSNETFGDGSFTLYGEDGEDTDADGIVDGDGDLDDDNQDPLTLTAIGTCGGVTHRVGNVVSIVPGGGRVLLVVPNAASLTAQQQARKTLLEGWGYQVSLISGSATQAAFDAHWDNPDTGVQNIHAVYVVNDVDDISLQSELTQAPVGLVAEARQIDDPLDEMGIAQGGQHYSDTTMHVANDTHYITDPYSVAALTISSSAQPLSYISGAPALGSGAVILAKQNAGGAPSLVAYEAGTELRPDSGVAIGTPAPARRVVLPWGGPAFNINALNSNGLEIMHRAVAWVLDGAPVTRYGFDQTGSGAPFVNQQESDDQIGFKIDVPESGMLTSISLNMTGPSPEYVRYALYTDSGGKPGNLVCQTPRTLANAHATDFRWILVSTPATQLSAGSYWVAFSPEASTQFKSKNGGVVHMRDVDALPDPGFLTTWGTTEETQNWTICSYANIMLDSQRGSGSATAVVYGVRWVEQL